MCRTSATRKELVRFVLRKAESDTWRITLDTAQTMTGRGAYCHLRAQCLGNRDFAESIVRSLLCRGKRILEGVAERESFEKIYERAKGEFERSQKEGQRTSPAGSAVLKRTGEILRSEASQPKAVKLPKRKIRI